MNHLVLLILPIVEQISPPESPMRDQLLSYYISALPFYKCKGGNHWLVTFSPLLEVAGVYDYYRDNH
jgi:hypothetical protein